MPATERARPLPGAMPGFKYTTLETEQILLQYIVQHILTSEQQGELGQGPPGR